MSSVMEPTVLLGVFSIIWNLYVFHPTWATAEFYLWRGVFFYLVWFLALTCIWTIIPFSRQLWAFLKYINVIFLLWTVIMFYFTLILHSVWKFCISALLVYVLPLFFCICIYFIVLWLLFTWWMLKHWGKIKVNIHMSPVSENSILELSVWHHNIIMIETA